jgi:hypothetical protein
MWVTAPFKPAGFFPNKKPGAEDHLLGSCPYKRKTRAKKVKPGFPADLP